MLSLKLPLGLVLALGVAAPPPAAGGRGGPIERVVAFVDETPIFLSELERRARLRFPDSEGGTSSHRRALETLIDDVLLERVARSHGYPITEELLSSALEGQREEANLTEEQHREQLIGAGSSLAAHRDELRSRLLRMYSMQVLTYARVRVDEQEIRREYERRQASRQGGRYRAAMITVSVEGVAQEVLAQLRAGHLDVPEAIARYGGVAMHEWDVEELLPPLGEALRATPPRTLSEVVATDEHYTIVSRDSDLGGAMPPYEDARQAIYEELFRERLRVEQPLVMQELRDAALIERRIR